MNSTIKTVLTGALLGFGFTGLGTLIGIITGNILLGWFFGMCCALGLLSLGVEEE